jgi:hypothetical protein
MYIDLGGYILEMTHRLFNFLMYILTDRIGDFDVFALDY